MGNVSACGGIDWGLYAIVGNETKTKQNLIKNHVSRDAFVPTHLLKRCFITKQLIVHCLSEFAKLKRSNIFG